MLHLLYKYFILNHRACLPGLGAFYVDRRSATLDFSNRQFVAPSASVIFNNNEDISDSNFYSFIAVEQQIEEDTARESLRGFCSALKERLLSEGVLQLPGFGVLKRNKAGEIQFNSSQPVASFFTNVPYEKIISQEPVESNPVIINEIKEEAAEEIESESLETPNIKRDYWWVYAIIIASIAIAGIVYYYNQNGSLR